MSHVRYSGELYGYEVSGIWIIGVAVPRIEKETSVRDAKEAVQTVLGEWCCASSPVREEPQ